MKHLTVLSHHLPVRLERDCPGGWRLRPSSGELQGALEPVLRARGGAWVGRTGEAGGLPAPARGALEAHVDAERYRLVPVSLPPRGQDASFGGACDRVLWPLLHGMSERCRHRPTDALAYRTMNERFAAVTASAARSDTIWVHDYPLLGAGEALRRALPAARLGFFLHAPFPPAEVMLQLPWGADLLPSLAAYDLVGFQTEGDRRNFRAWWTLLSERHRVGAARGPDVPPTSPDERTGVFPVAPDYRAFHDGARTAAVAERARAIRQEMRGRRMLLAVDRLDYVNGIPHRLRAFERMLEQHPELHGTVILDQLVVPSRGGIAHADRLRDEIDRLVGRIGGRFARSDWDPIRYVYGRVERDEILARYVAADVAVVTPLRAGMGTAAKEFGAANPGTGVLVLSEFAGAAAELTAGAVTVNPWDAEGFARALHSALALDAEARAARMARLRRRLRAWDAHAWAHAFLEALAEVRPALPGATVGLRLRPAPTWPRRVQARLPLLPEPGAAERSAWEPPAD